VNFGFGEEGKEFCFDAFEASVGACLLSGLVVVAAVDDVVTGRLGIDPDVVVGVICIPIASGVYGALGKFCSDGVACIAGDFGLKECAGEEICLAEDGNVRGDDNVFAGQGVTVDFDFNGIFCEFGGLGVFKQVASVAWNCFGKGGEVFQWMELPLVLELNGGSIDDGGCVYEGGVESETLRQCGFGFEVCV